nr:hypothetical protein OAC_18470 [Vibrio cyclitrophicus 1F273]
MFIFVRAAQSIRPKRKKRKARMDKPLSKAAENIIFLLNGNKGLTKAKIANSLRYPRLQVQTEIDELLDAGLIKYGPYKRLILVKPLVEDKPKSDCKVCDHCGKGSNHFTEWDFPEGNKDGTGECKNSHRWGGCVGDWTCEHAAQKEREEKENKKYAIYGGRLGYIIGTYPKVHCPICQTPQVQLTHYLTGDPKYKCRHCKQTFSLPFKPTEE